MTNEESWSYNFLALMLWREARGSSREAKIAVAWVVMNRVARPSWWGTNVVDVVKKKWQFSSMTDPKDVQLTTWPSLSDSSFIECLEIAKAVYLKEIPCPLFGIDSYYDDSLQGSAVPKWARENPQKLVGKIGRLNFYDMDNDHEVSKQV